MARELHQVRCRGRLQGRVGGPRGEGDEGLAEEMLLQPRGPQLLQLPPHGLQVQLQPGGGAVAAPAVEGVEGAARAAAWLG